MATAKIVMLTTMPERAEVTLSLAPPDLDVTYVDNNRPVEEKVPLCRDADAIITVPADLSVDLLKQCPRVKLVQTLSAGYDRLDLEAIGEMGIPVANNGGGNAIAVAEHTIGLMLSVGKKMMIQWDRAVRQRRWQAELLTVHMTEVTGKTVGIVGLGRIGKQVAKRLKGFDTETIYYDVAEIPQDVQDDLNAWPVPLDELLRESDIVTLHVPLTRRTRGMISDQQLEMMKPTAFLISTCRGPVTDEKALHRALVGGRIAAAGLDVLEKEPTPEDNPLFELENVVITPHMAGFSDETDVRNAEFAYANIKRVLAGEPPESVVTPE